MNIHIPSQYTFSYNHDQESLVCTNRFGEVEGVYPKTHPTEFMKTKGVQLASLVTSLGTMTVESISTLYSARKI